MNTKIKYLIFTLTLIAFIALCVFLEVNPSPKHQVRVEFISHSPYHLVDGDSIKKMVEKSTDSTHNDSLSHRLLEIEKDIAHNPYIEQALVYADPSGEILVKIKEHTPLYRVIGKNTDYYVSRDGSHMPLLYGQGIDIPLVSGEIDSLSHIDVVSVIDAMTKDPFFQDIFMGIDISRYNKGNGHGYTLTASTRLQDIKVILGDGSYIDEKIENFKALYTYLIKEDRLKEYKIVNLEFVDYLVLQRKK